LADVSAIKYNFHFRNANGIFTRMNRGSVIAAFRAALQSIGYENRLIASDYSFADFPEGAAKLKRIPLAAFAGYPCSYRNACIGVILIEGPSVSSSDLTGYRALGAPLLFAVAEKQVQPWAIGPEQAKVIGSAFAPDRIGREFAENKGHWNPEALGRVRSPSDVKPNQQLDFFDTGLLPVLEEFFQTKLKDLLERAFQDTAACYQQVHGRSPRVPFLFPYLFRFVTAKIFMDRADAKGWDGLGSAREVLEKAERHSGSGLLERLPKEFLDRRVLEKTWSSISKTLNFQNLSVPDLAFVYESSFINEQTRRELGIHSTPRGLAEYIVEHLPWQDVPVEDRHVFEPFCGHGIFLACALERLNRDLEPGLTARERHAYFRRLLVGVEKDPLAIEVCRLLLTLLDYPNDNSWQLHPEDVFAWSGWDAALKSAAVVLANPPYEPFTAEERQRIKAVKAQPPAEFLHRLMRQPPQMLGLVLPQSFLTSPFYQEANRQIANRYERVSIVELPRLFRYADNETIALMASGRREKGYHVAVRYSEVSHQGAEQFLQDFRVSAERSKTIAVADDAKVFTLWIPQRGSVFQRFTDSSTLEHVSLIRKGLNWKGRTDGKQRTAPRTDVASDTPRSGFHQGAEKMAGNLSQFQLLALRYLSLREEDQDPRTSAHKHPWASPKVVCNAARFERKSPWRLAAWADSEGLAFTKQYFAIWPQHEVSEFALAAILCSPLANAFSFELDLERDNHISTLNRLPIPATEHLQPSGKIHRQAKRLQSLLTAQDFTVEAAADAVTEAVLRLDAAVLEAYELPAQEQRRLLRKFRGWRRPLAVPFTEYFPDHFQDVVSLQNFVAIRYDWDTINERRCDLIEKEVAREPLTHEERLDLDHLQHLADLLVRLKDPYPLEELDKFIVKLKAEGKWSDTI
jgi:hypothetical protein